MSEPTVASLATYLFDFFRVGTAVEDVAIEEHRLACRRRVEGAGARHASTSNATSSSKTGPSPNKKDRDDHYECLNCSRSIGAPRYASHLSGCMGVAGIGGTRRGESRRAAAMAANGSGRGVNGLSRFGVERASSVSSQASDDETASGSERKSLVLKLPLANQNKRSSSTPISGSKPKKHKPGPTHLSTSHLASEPLSKTFSAPNTTTASPSKQPAGNRAPIQPMPPHTNPHALHSQPMASRGGKGSDRPESDSSADDDVSEPSLQVAMARPPNGQKQPRSAMHFSRPTHPLANGFASASSDSDSENSN
ncbi:hypothetical protein T439DRAFT_227872 [Meredithblackwellia eburnea MCA 4105]